MQKRRVFISYWPHFKHKYTAMTSHVCVCSHSFFFFLFHIFISLRTGGRDLPSRESEKRKNYLYTRIVTQHKITAISRQEPCMTTSCKLSPRWLPSSLDNSVYLLRHSRTDKNEKEHNVFLRMRYRVKNILDTTHYVREDKLNPSYFHITLPSILHTQSEW